MRLLFKLPGLVGIAFLLACTATVAAQLVGFGMAWSRGLLNAEKMVRYAGVVYGLDPLDLVPPKRNNRQQAKPETREEILADRVQKTPRLMERLSAISQRTEEIRGITLTLRRNREKYVAARDSFESLLDQLEAETASRALRDVQITMELVSSKQAKDILRSMLTNNATDPADNVIEDVVGIVKTLPNDKLRKILAEFKTDEERQLLHRILVEIGDLDGSSDQLSRSIP